MPAAMNGSPVTCLPQSMHAHIEDALAKRDRHVEVAGVHT